MYVIIQLGCRSYDMSLDWDEDLFVSCSGTTMLYFFDLFPTSALTRLRIIMSTIHLCFDWAQLFIVEVCAIFILCWWGYPAIRSTDKLYSHRGILQSLFIPFLSLLFLSLRIESFEKWSLVFSLKKCRELSDFQPDNSWFYIFLRDWWDAWDFLWCQICWQMEKRKLFMAFHAWLSCSKQCAPSASTIRTFWGPWFAFLP